MVIRKFMKKKSEMPDIFTYYFVEETQELRFGLGSLLLVAKNKFFAVFSALAFSKNVVISDIFGQTLITVFQKMYQNIFFNVFYPPYVLLHNSYRFSSRYGFFCLSSLAVLM